MRDYLFFLVSNMIELYDLEKIKEFNDFFADTGISVELGEIIENTNYRELKIKYDEFDFAKWKSRNAGRRPVKSKKTYYVAEIRKRMENETADEIARDIGISRATLFRRLKRAEENGYTFL